MPKLEATPDVLMEIGDRLYMGELKTLHIRRYKTGVNAGKLFAEYTLKEGIVPFDNSTIQKRAVVSNIVKKGALALHNGKDIDLAVRKLNASEEKYTHMLVVKGGK